MQQLSSFRPRDQIGLGIGTTIFLLASFYVAHSLLPLLIFLGGYGLWKIVQNPKACIYAFIVLSVGVSLKPKPQGSEGSLNILDVVFGVTMIAIIVYWTIRIRFFENTDLHLEPAQLLLGSFFVWALFISAYHLVFDNTNLLEAIREILNLSPLFILPILYRLGINSDRKAQKQILAAVLIASSIIIISNFIVMRQNVAHAVYLFETGRGALDISLSVLSMIIMTSIMMSNIQKRNVLPTILFFLFATAGLVISFTRGLYVPTVITIALMLVIATPEERKRGVARLAMSFILVVAILTPIVLHVRIIRLLLLGYWTRFSSSVHIKTDLSLRMRYQEWSDEWHAITHSPIVGHGFGAHFLTVDLLEGVTRSLAFSHNGFLYIIFKTGFLGATLFFGSLIIFLWKSFQLSRFGNLPSADRIMVRVSWAFIIIVFFAAYSGPILDTKTDMVWLGILLGYLDSTFQRFKIKELSLT